MSTRWFEVRDVDDDFDRWTQLEADSYEHTAEIYADNHELGCHSWQEMAVVVRDMATNDEKRFNVTVEWEPSYYAEEIKDE